MLHRQSSHRVTSLPVARIVLILKAEFFLRTTAVWDASIDYTREWAHDDTPLQIRDSSRKLGLLT
jgi:hypothetical protein